MYDHITSLPGAIITAGAVVAVLGSWWKWLRPWWRGFRSDWRAGRDALVGRDAVVDSITGKELAPALPGIGARMATVEQALVTFAQNQSDLHELKERVNKHQDDIDALKSAAGERMLARADSIRAFEAIEAALHSTPDEPDRDHTLEP